MTKILVIYLVLLVFSYFNIGKADIIENKTDSSEYAKNEDNVDESDSIQVVQRAVATDKVDTSLISDEIQREEENHTEIQSNTYDDTSTNKAIIDINNDSGESKNQNDNLQEVSEGEVTESTPIEESNDLNNRKENIEIVIEDITEAINHDEKNHEESVMVDEEESNWRSAEHSDSGENKDVENAANEEISAEARNYSDEENDHIDKKFGSEGRSSSESRKPARREHVMIRTNPRHFGAPEDHDILDPGPMRRFSDVMVPRYRPVLTRTGIVYTPTLFSMQSHTSLFDRLSGHNWVPNRVQSTVQGHLEPETYSKPRSTRVVGVTPYESKMIDDYNDYGSNAYSYTPIRKVTTQAPPQQMAAPNKVDVFQKLVEASNHPKPQKRMMNDYPGNYHPQRQSQYPESYGYGIRRHRREVWDEQHSQNI